MGGWVVVLGMCAFPWRHLQSVIWRQHSFGRVCIFARASYISTRIHGSPAAYDTISRVCNTTQWRPLGDLLLFASLGPANTLSWVEGLPLLADDPHKVGCGVAVVTAFPNATVHDTSACLVVLESGRNLNGTALGHADVFRVADTVGQAEARLLAKMLQGCVLVLGVPVFRTGLVTLSCESSEALGVPAHHGSTLALYTLADARRPPVDTRSLGASTGEGNSADRTRKVAIVHAREGGIELLQRGVCGQAQLVGIARTLDVSVHAVHTVSCMAIDAAWLSAGEMGGVEVRHGQCRGTDRQTLRRSMYWDCQPPAARSTEASSVQCPWQNMPNASCRCNHARGSTHRWRSKCTRVCGSNRHEPE